MSVDTFGRHNWEEGCTSIWWVEAGRYSTSRNAQDSSTPTRNYSAPNVNGAQVEKPCSRTNMPANVHYLHQREEGSTWDPSNKLSSNFLYHKYTNSLNKTTLVFRKTSIYECTKPCRLRYVRKHMDALDVFFLPPSFLAWFFPFSCLFLSRRSSVLHQFLHTGILSSKDKLTLIKFLYQK